MTRCESDNCIAPATVALTVDNVEPKTEIYFCRACFDLIEHRCAKYGEQRAKLLARGVPALLADSIISARIERREVG